jgi:cytochrome c553
MRALAFFALSMLAAAVAAESPVDIQPGGDPGRGHALSTSCASCHDGDGRSRFGMYPRIAGQHYAYLLNALKEFRTKERHQAFAFQMWDPTLEMSEQDVRDLAAYYAQLPW